ncbi:MAG: DNA-3-methyladenine glycosylase I [Chloroflexi bacterium]|nr:DNA-3-methyladenine glycosylase I [Chloroflexota bacterium]
MPKIIERRPGERPANDDGYLEEMTKVIFQAGFSWELIRRRWPAFRQAFDGFVVDKVADYDERDVDRLLSDASIVRNSRKIEATVANARLIQALSAKHGSFHAYLRTLDSLPYRDKQEILSRQFRHLGRTGCFAFLLHVGEEVPEWEQR